MFANLFRSLRRAYSSLTTFVVAALLVGATVAAWHFYQQEHLRAQLETEGQPVTVQIARTDRRPRQVWDRFGSYVYVGFEHQGRPYEVRCASPSTRWLATGDQLELRYLAGSDVFGQPLAAPPVRGRPGVSRLIDWSALPDFTPETLALTLFVFAAGALFFVGSGLLASLTGWRVFSALARPVGAVVLAAGAVYFTYDTAQYYRYAAALRRDGQPMTVAVRRADQHIDQQATRSGSSGGFRTYTFTATFQHQGQEREVAIERADYDRFMAGNRRLAVRYDTVRDDFITEGYSPRWLPLLVPLFFWGLLGWVLWPSRARPAPAGAYASVSKE